ncbi:MAG: type I-E CRISPR-associated protein Cas6/Cse3/CasE [Chloroflexaceae bacterium]|jgi:CRISPR system Cascade subunit CasE|nr:type I-E CRISPR-associated protein Cas6/Cse3/CasE [Chloroflexaceae bacterium]
MMLTHTTIQLNLTHAEVQRDLNDCQGMHRRIMRLFQHVNATRDTNEILYRIDRNGADWQLLIQSTAYADVTSLPAGYARPPIRQHDDVWERYATIQTGQQLPFMVVANIVKRDNVLRAMRTIYDVAEQHVWLARKGIQHGFAVDMTAQALVPLTIDRDPPVTGVHPNGQLSYDAFRIRGTLTVTDAAQCVQALVTGIGKAKAYGFGLLSVVGV